MWSDSFVRQLIDVANSCGLTLNASQVMQLLNQYCQGMTEMEAMMRLPALFVDILTNPDKAPPTSEDAVTNIQNHARTCGYDISYEEALQFKKVCFRNKSERDILPLLPEVLKSYFEGIAIEPGSVNQALSWEGYMDKGADSVKFELCEGYPIFGDYRRIGDHAYLTIDESTITIHLIRARFNDMTSLFEYCKGIRFVDFTGLDTTLVCSVAHLFDGCSSLESVTFTGVNMPRLTNMVCMFSCCGSLRSVDLSGLNMSNVPSTEYMFFECSSLCSVELWNKGTPKLISMHGMFCECESLYYVGLQGFSTESLEHMRSLFEGCKGLYRINFPALDASVVKNVERAFIGHGHQFTLDVTHWCNVTPELLRTLGISWFATLIVTAQQYRALEGAELSVRLVQLDNISDEHVRLIRYRDNHYAVSNSHSAVVSADKSRYGISGTISEFELKEDLLDRAIQCYDAVTQVLRNTLNNMVEDICYTGTALLGNDWYSKSENSDVLKDLHTLMHTAVGAVRSIFEESGIRTQEYTDAASAGLIWQYNYTDAIVLTIKYNLLSMVLAKLTAGSGYAALLHGVITTSDGLKMSEFSANSVDDFHSYMTSELAKITNKGIRESVAEESGVMVNSTITFVLEHLLESEGITVSRERVYAFLIQQYLGVSEGDLLLMLPELVDGLKKSL